MPCQELNPAFGPPLRPTLLSRPPLSPWLPAHVAFAPLLRPTLSSWPPPSPWLPAHVAFAPLLRPMLSSRPPLGQHRLQHLNQDFMRKKLIKGHSEKRQNDSYVNTQRVNP